MDENNIFTCEKCGVSEKDGCVCPVGATLELIGGKYKPLILWYLAANVMRYGELHRMIPKATNKVLTQQLRELENAGLVTRTVFPVVPPKVEYKLTELGMNIKPVLDVMYAWGAGYLAENGEKTDCPGASCHCFKKLI